MSKNYRDGSYEEQRYFEAGDSVSSPTLDGLSLAVDQVFV